MLAPQKKPLKSTACIGLSKETLILMATYFELPLKAGITPDASGMR
jgi:hypothetical protein